LVDHNPAPPTENRLKRWGDLNGILNINKKAKLDEDGKCSTGYSYVTWAQVESIFPVIEGTVTSEAAPITVEDEMLSALTSYLSYATKCMGKIVSGKEAKKTIILLR